MSDDRTDDPVLARRARVAQWAERGQRLGYVLIAAAVIAFVVGFALGFPAASVTVVMVSLIAACVAMPPAIIAGYAVKAAEREDREAGRTP